MFRLDDCVYAMKVLSASSSQLNSSLFAGVGAELTADLPYAGPLSDNEKNTCKYLKYDNASGLMFPEEETKVTQVWMSHFDYISKLAPGFKSIAYTGNCPVAELSP